MLVIRRLSAVAAAALIALLYALAYYGLRSTMFLRLDEAGGDVTQLMSLVAMAGLVGTLSAIVPGALLGPSGTAAVGLGWAALGAVLVAAGVVTPGYVVMGFGLGMYRPTLFAVVVRPFRKDEGMAIAAAAVLAYLALNGGAWLAADLGRRAWELAPAVGAIGAAVVFLLAAGLAVVDGLVQWLAPPEGPPTSLDVRPVLVGLALAVLVGGSQALWAFGSEAQYSLLVEGLDQLPILANVNPLAVLAAGLPLAAALGAAAIMDFRVPPALVGGVGLAALGIGLASTWPVVSALQQPTGSLVVLLLGGAAEVLAWPVLLATCARGAHWRASVAVTAIPAAASTVGSLTLSVVSDLPPGVTVGVGVALGLVGAALAGVSIPLERWFSVAPPDAGG